MFGDARWWFSGFVWAFWLVLGGLLCEWWWVLVFCWVCSGRSDVFEKVSR